MFFSLSFSKQAVRVLTTSPGPITPAAGGAVGSADGRFRPCFGCPFQSSAHGVGIQTSTSFSFTHPARCAIYQLLCGRVNRGRPHGSPWSFSDVLAAARAARAAVRQPARRRPSRGRLPCTAGLAPLPRPFTLKVRGALSAATRCPYTAPRTTPTSSLSRTCAGSRGCPPSDTPEPSADIGEGV